MQSSQQETPTQQTITSNSQLYFRISVNEELCPYSDLDEHKNKTHRGLSVTCAIQCSRGEMIKKTIHEGL